MRINDIINEAPLPDDWDAEIYDITVPFSKRIEYAKLRAKRIGTGSSRIAFEIPYENRKTILKIAKNRKGLAQTQQEYEILSDGYYSTMGLFIPMIDADEQGFTWIHTEFAEKAKDSDFKSACGGTLSQLIKYAVAGHTNTAKFREMEKIIDSDSELAMNMMDFYGNLNRNDKDLFMEYSRLANWGVYNGTPVIIDAGLSDEIYIKYYKRR